MMRVPMARLWRSEVRAGPHAFDSLVLPPGPGRSDKPLPALIQQELSLVRIAVPPACSGIGELAPSPLV